MPRRSAAWLKDKLVPGLGSAVRLSAAREDEALPFVPDVGTLSRAELPPGGAVERAVEAVHIHPAFMLHDLRGGVGGDAVPEWADGRSGGLRFGVNLARVTDVHHAPGFGAVIDGGGRVFESTAAAARYLSPELTVLPGVRAGGRMFVPPREAPVLDSAAVFAPWGGRTNYGHFLLDGLSSLTLFAERGLLSTHPAVAPPLEGWQRELLALLLRPGETVTELAAPTVRVGDLVFASSMDHFLHGPNRPLDRTRARILEAAPTGGGGAFRVYLSRRSQTKRVLVNEVELEAALAARGFIVVEPEALSVTEQIVLFRNASVVVAATGAALANALFLPPGAQVFEIQPSNFVGIWVRALCQMVGARWRGYFRQSPLEETEIRVGGVLQPGLRFTWDLPLPPFLDFLDARI